MIIELIYEDHCGITQTKGHLLSLNKLRYKRLGSAALYAAADHQVRETRGHSRAWSAAWTPGLGQPRPSDAAAAVSGPPQTC